MQETTVQVVVNLIEDLAENAKVKNPNIFKENGITESDFKQVVTILKSYNNYGELDPETGWAILSEHEYNKLKGITCCICGKKIDDVKHGNNPWPVKADGYCCDECNENIVLLERIKQILK